MKNFFNILLFSLFAFMANTHLAQALTRTAILNNAAPYRTYAFTANATNISTCTGSIPAPWVVVGSNTAAPYCWGGWNTPAEMTSGLANNKRAGNTNTSSTSSFTSCSIGLDCSGFVSRAWGLSSKQSTSSIPSISSQITFSALAPGDVVNKAGSHVRLIHTLFEDGTWQVQESCNCAGQWKNMYNTYDLTALQGEYIPRKHTSTTPNPNDEPCGAVDLDLKPNPHTGDNIGAIITTNPAYPTACNLYGVDVWYKVKIPTTGTLTVRLAAGTLTDAVMAIYSGTSCSNLTYITCEDDNTNGNNSAMPVLTVTGTANSTRYIRVSGKTADPLTFGIGNYLVTRLNYATTNKTEEPTPTNNISTNFKAYPNPINANSANLKLSFNANTEQPAAIQLFSIEGKNINTYNFTTQEGYNTFEIQTNNLPAGTYFIKATINGSIHTQKITVIR